MKLLLGLSLQFRAEAGSITHGRRLAMYARCAQKSIELQHQFGTIKSTIEVTQYTDLSLVKEAAQRLARDPGAAR
jgi:hypothetical protein